LDFFQLVSRVGRRGQKCIELALVSRHRIRRRPRRLFDKRIPSVFVAQAFGDEHLRDGRRFQIIQKHAGSTSLIGLPLQRANPPIDDDGGDEEQRERDDYQGERKHSRFAGLRMSRSGLSRHCVYYQRI
jgi:hypothetical protein